MASIRPGVGMAARNRVLAECAKEWPARAARPMRPISSRIWVALSLLCFLFSFAIILKPFRRSDFVLYQRRQLEAALPRQIA